MIPEINVQQLAERLQTDEKFTILDVREAWEVDLARLEDPRVHLLPLSQLARNLLDAFPAELRDPQTPLVILCHHGARSANVTGWMRQQGWQNVHSLQGGIAAYAEQIQPSIGFY
jgi:rhodanese-related sulfurtransferase